MMMTKKILITLLAGTTLTFAQNIPDEDFDGVPDNKDKCPHTPFLNQVDANGCTTTILTLPDETEYDSLTLTLGYGTSINEDLVGRKRQDTATMRLSYYHDDWSISLRSGHYKHRQGNGLLDTTLKIKKRIKLSSKLRVRFGAGLKFPTYDFVGNRTDILLDASLYYYAGSKLSVFGGLGHTFVRDKATVTPLRDTTNLYVGAGYFFTDRLYTGISFGFDQSKFTDEHAEKSLTGTLYYKISRQWFSTLSYYYEIDSYRHDAWTFNIGYQFW